MGWNLITVDTVYFGLSLLLTAFYVGKTTKTNGTTIVAMLIAFVANLLAMVGTLPR